MNPDAQLPASAWELQASEPISYRADSYRAEAAIIAKISRATKSKLTRSYRCPEDRWTGALCAKNLRGTFQGRKFAGQAEESRRGSFTIRMMNQSRLKITRCFFTRARDAHADASGSSPSGCRCSTTTPGSSSHDSGSMRAFHSCAYSRKRPSRRNRAASQLLPLSFRICACSPPYLPRSARLRTSQTP